MAPRIATYLSIFLSLWSLVAAESIPKTDYDVIVVGGGPAGLSALSGVSRVRRTALLFDNQEYRNAPTRNMHDVIGNDGNTPNMQSIGHSTSQTNKMPQALRQPSFVPWLASRSSSIPRLILRTTPSSRSPPLARTRSLYSPLLMHQARTTLHARSSSAPVCVMCFPIPPV
jgi:hypothetical protein